MSSTAVVVPQGLELPAHLRTPEAAASIAATNAAAAGGIKTGGFPKISIEGSKFHEVDASIDGGAPRTYMVNGQPGQPQLPMMCLEAVIVDANPALVKTYYEKKWVKGSAEAPDCQSTNGITPDVGVPKKQADVCATCPQNQWGSKISEASGKEIKACSDTKQMVILPGADLTYKALGLAVTPAALGDWGKYVKALSERGIAVNAVVTNITFDTTASFPKLQFAFNRFLTAAEYAQVQERQKGDDVRAIISPTRTIALPAPVAQAALPAPAPAPVPPAPPPPAPPAPVTGFGAAKPADAATTAKLDAAAEPLPPRTRAKREKPAAPVEDLSYLPAAIQEVLKTMPAGPGRDALLASFPKPVAQATAPAAPPPAATPAPAAPATGFGATASAAPVATAPTAAVTAAGASLKELLQKKLGITSPAAG